MFRRLFFVAVVSRAHGREPGAAREVEMNKRLGLGVLLFVDGLVRQLAISYLLFLSSMGERVEGMARPWYWLKDRYRRWQRTGDALQRQIDLCLRKAERERLPDGQPKVAERWIADAVKLERRLEKYRRRHWRLMQWRAHLKSEIWTVVVTVLLLCLGAPEVWARLNRSFKVSMVAFGYLLTVVVVLLVAVAIAAPVRIPEMPGAILLASLVVALGVGVGGLLSWLTAMACASLRWGVQAFGSRQSVRRLHVQASTSEEPVGPWTYDITE